MNFEDLIAKVTSCGKQRLAVAAAADDAVLEAVNEAQKMGIVDATLVGDEAAIRKDAEALSKLLGGQKHKTPPLRDSEPAGDGKAAAMRAFGAQLLADE